MGICIRRAYKRVLSFIPHSLPRTVVSGSDHTKEQMDMYLHFKHSLPCWVRFVSPIIHLSGDSPGDRFAQYIYGVYLGLNGKWSDRMMSVHDLMWNYSATLFSALWAVTSSVATSVHCIHSLFNWIQRSATCTAAISWVITVHVTYIIYCLKSQVSRIARMLVYWRARLV